MPVTPWATVVTCSQDLSFSTEYGYAPAVTTLNPAFKVLVISSFLCGSKDKA